MSALSKLSLFNVRNHHEQTFELGPLTILVGPNGSGKTNVLEAISVVSTTRSWRVKRESELVLWGEEFARIVAGPVEVVISPQPYRKTFWVDGVRTKLKDVVGTVKTVLFQPDDIAIVAGAPADRRHFLNVLLSQHSHEYSSALLEYAHVVVQRNRLLKRVRDEAAHPDELAFWDDELVKLGAVLWAERAGFLAILGERLPAAYREISGDKREVRVRHETKPHDPERLAEELAAVRDREVILGQTLRGPHRDDLHFLFDDHPAMEAASRGEIRSLTFAIKMIELEYLASRSAAAAPAPVSSQEAAYDVILLLDDVMSELDEKRRARLVEAARRTQTIVTTTDLDDIPATLLEGATIIDFTAGKMKQTSSQ